MRYDQGPYENDRYGYGQTYGAAVAPDTRDRFLVRTYNHLFGAILLFTGIEFALFLSGLAQPIAAAMLSLPWIAILGIFMIAGWGATHLAARAESKAVQYAGLAAYVLIEAIIFVPMLFIANHYAPGAIQSAGLVTILGFAALTGIVFWTKKDFSFLRGFLLWGGVAAILLIVGGAIFGFQLGIFFTVAMIGFAGAAILYDTSRVLRDYPEDRHVAAALSLFASVALLFWYVLQLFLSRRD